jgi:hypothetical protein
MSYRSALASPTTQNGGVGTTLTVNLTADIPLTDGGTFYTCNLTLGKGLWVITSTTNIKFSAGVSYTGITSYLQYTSATVPFFNYLNNNRNTAVAVVTAGLGNEQGSQTFTLLVPDDSAIIRQIVVADFSTGTVSAGVSGAGTNALWAVKIA